MIDAELPVLVLAPTGRDAHVAAAILGEERIASRICRDLTEVVACLDSAACAVLTEEALFSSNRQVLADWIGAQPPWSDFPFEARANLEERERSAERQTLLIRELHHRVKNTLATVQALLGASSRSATSVEAFYTSFSARVISLAKTHNLLTEDYWQQAPLRDMLINELGPYNDSEGSRIVLDGPRVDLVGDLAVPTGMAIHELTTNAAKHGALSVPEGRIRISWTVEKTAAHQVLCLDWIERGGPPTEPPTRKGFGSTLLQRVLKVQCQAELAFDYQPAGLHFSMRAPLPEQRIVPAY